MTLIILIDIIAVIALLTAIGTLLFGRRYKAEKDINIVTLFLYLALLAYISFLLLENTASYLHTEEIENFIGAIIPVIWGFLIYASILKQKKYSEINKEKLSQMILNSIGDGVVSTDNHGRIKSMNPMAEKLSGWTFQEAKNKPISDVFNIIDPYTGQPAENLDYKIIQSIRNNKTPVNKTLISKNGIEYQIVESGAVFQNSLGQNVGLILVFRDLTALTGLKKDILEKEKMFNLAILGADLGIWTWDVEKNIFKVSERSLEILGFETDDPFIDINKWIELIHPDDREQLTQGLEQHLEGKSITFETEHRMKAKDGSWKWILSRGKVLQWNENGTAIRAAGTHLDITDRKLNEQTIRENYQKYRALFNQSVDAIYLYDLQGTVIDMNKAAEIQSGYTKRDLLGTSIFKLFPDDANQRKIKSDWVNWALNESHRYDDPQKRKNGDLIPVEIITSKVHFGSDERIITIARDITERKKYEVKLRKSEERYRSFIRQSREGIYRFELDSPMDISMSLDDQVAFIFDHAYLAECNEAFAKMYQANSTGELIGRPIIDFYGSTKDQQNIEYNRKFIISGYKIDEEETRELTQDGQKVWLSNSSIGIIDNGLLLRIWGTQRNITLHKEADQALFENEQKYRSLIEKSQDIVFLYYEGKFELINKKFQEVFKLSLDEINQTGFSYIDIINPEYREEISAVLKDISKVPNRQENIEFTFTNSAGKIINVESSITSINYKNGVAVQGILRDVTNRKKLEEQLRQSQKMEAVGQLAGGVAHDFNNLLTVINGYSELILSKNLAPGLEDSIEEIANAGKKAARLTSQLLAFSRKQIIKPEILDINKLINDQMKMLRRLLGEDIEIAILLSSSIGPIKIDPGQMDQIIMNLAVNSRDAMPEGGKLTIETAIKEFDAEYLKDHAGTKPGKFVMIAVSDTGVGMDKKTQRQIFEPFFTTKGKYKGTGLGLATVYGIVKQSNGFVYVYSEVGIGTSIKIYFPIINEKINDSEKREIDLTDLNGHEIILLVEDEQSVRKITEENLKTFGYNVVSAENGEEALRIFENSKDKYDLVLTDVIMPLMGGRQLAEKILSQRPEQKILFHSGYTDDSKALHGILEDNVDFIQKPFTHISLAKKIRSVLNN